MAMLRPTFREVLSELFAAQAEFLVVGAFAMSAHQVEDLSRPGLVFWMGKAPNRIDVMTAIDGVSFDEAWETRVYREVGGVVLPVLSLENLLKNKKSTGRPKDGFDAAWIEEESGSE